MCRFVNSTQNSTNWEQVWEHCFKRTQTCLCSGEQRHHWKVVQLKKPFPEYIHDEEFQKCFKSQVQKAGVRGTVLFGDPTMTVGVDEHGTVYVIIFATSDDEENIIIEF